jgi:hypothetical protein
MFPRYCEEDLIHPESFLLEVVRFLIPHPSFGCPGCDRFLDSTENCPDFFFGRHVRMRARFAIRGYLGYIPAGAFNVYLMNMEITFPQ